MTTRTVTGNIKTLTDSAVSSGTVTFEKVVTSTTGNTIHQFGTTTATTDGSGDFSIALAVPASGSYRYRMILPNGDAFYFSIESGASVNVATLIIAETITDSDAIVAALAAYLPLSGGTMTGQLNFSGTTHAGIKLLTLTTAQRDALTPANGMVIYNSTTSTVQVYQGGAWASIGGGGGASDVTDLTTTTGNVAEMLNVAAGGGLQYRTVAQVLADLRDSGALATPDLGVTVQGYSAKTAAIAALTWAANSIILLTGAATASVQAIAAHVVTFIQSATAADARTAIGAGTGNGDLLASNNLSDVTASTARTNLAVPGLADANTFTAHNLFQITDAVTNATTIGITLEHQSSGTPATFFGSSIKFLLESTTTAGQDAGLIDARWATATHASRLAVLELSAYYIGTKTSLQIYPMTSGSYAKLVWGTNADQGLWRESNEQVISGASVGFKSYNGSAYVFSARVDGDTTAGNTRLLIYDVDNAAIERVSVGAPNSGGSGYKVLRIPN